MGLLVHYRIEQVRQITLKDLRGVWRCEAVAWGAWNIWYGVMPTGEILRFALCTGRRWD